MKPWMPHVNRKDVAFIIVIAWHRTFLEQFGSEMLAKAAKLAFYIRDSRISTALMWRTAALSLAVSYRLPATGFVTCVSLDHITSYQPFLQPLNLPPLLSQPSPPLPGRALSTSPVWTSSTARHYG